MRYRAREYKDGQKGQRNDEHVEETVVAFAHAVSDLKHKINTLLKQ